MAGDPHILVVEDEPKLAQLLVDYLKEAGFKTSVLDNGSGVTSFVQANRLDAILLDVMLPGKDGWSVCREIREFSDVPILMVTARVEEIDRLLGLEIGADDYICKPFSPREVVARVKVILRRINRSSEQVTSWQLEEASYEFCYQQKRVSLSAIEFQLLKKMTTDPGRIFTRDHLMTDRTIVL